MNRYKISEVAKLKHVKPETLRYYDEIGLLKPSYIEESTGYRYYSANQFIDVDIIKFYKMIGMSLKDIKATLAIENLNERLDRINEQNDTFLKKIEEHQRLVREMNRVIKRIKGAQEEYELLGATPILTIKESIYGFSEDVDIIRDAYEMETYLYKLNKKNKLGDLIQHNQGIVSVGDLTKIAVGEPFTEKIIIRRYLEDGYDQAIEELPVGLCVRALHKGDRKSGRIVIQDMLEFIKRENLNPTGKVIVCTIIDNFIVNQASEEMMEFIIPVNRNEKDNV